MRKKSLPILVAGILSGICVAQAQEFTALPAARSATIRREPPPWSLSSEYSLHGLRKRTSPAPELRYEIGGAPAERAQRSVLLRSESAARRQDPNREVALWRLTIGNTAAGNWSPYPDRALDARNLRFPLPRNLTPDKRPEHIRQLDKLKH